MTTRHTPFTEEEFREFWATWGGDQRFTTLEHSHGMRVAAFEYIRHVFSELRRLRGGEWVERAAREIATSAECGDVAASNAMAIARVLRRHLDEGH